MARNWSREHREGYTFGQRAADESARMIGSWPFIIAQTVLVALWMILNVVAWRSHWDPYPFILRNLLFSIQAAYAGPIIMMSQNRQSERDRVQAQAQADYDTNLKAELETAEILTRLERIESTELKRIVELLEARA